MLAFTATLGITARFALLGRALDRGQAVRCFLHREGPAASLSATPGAHVPVEYLLRTVSFRIVLSRGMGAPDGPGAGVAASEARANLGGEALEAARGPASSYKCRPV